MTNSEGLVAQRLVFRTVELRGNQDCKRLRGNGQQPKVEECMQIRAQK